MNLIRRSYISLRSDLLCKYQKSEKFATASKCQQQAETQTKTTIDPKDINQHAKLQKVWWDEFGAIKPLHSMNLLRVPFVRDGLVQCSPDKRTTEPLANKKILDVGCGGGIFSEGLAKVGAKVTGIDAGKDLIELAKHHSKQNPKLSNNLPSYICTSVEEHCQERKNYYDAVVASEVIEHVTDKELFVKACVETLKPDGKIFFTTPNRSRLTQIFGIYVAEYILNITPRGTHQYEKFMTPNELTFLLERNNCHVELSYGVIYYPFSNRWEFIESKLFAFAMQARKMS
ncbi:ubiquinone biosynthesis O-methyltransferase, mitochondrial-like [Battus philenor]|uniref:ubiquinone biosynthesis O-methyltransferase, mitochondrial-like n=1 Tax=Battus philenor TaxID=42288 RepID=UPI0035D021DE